MLGGGRAGVSAAAIARLTGRPGNRRLAVLGDSRTAGSITGTATAPVWENNSWINWARFLGRQRFDFPWGNNFGVGGDTTVMMLARLPAALALSDAGTWVVLGGVNDRGTAAMTAAETIASLTSIRDMILAAGRLVVFIAEIPKGDSTYTSYRLTGDQLGYHFRVHQWLLEQRSVPGVYVCDVWDKFAVENSTTGDAIAGLTLDGLHPNIVGNEVIGAKLATTLEAIFAPVDLLPTSNADQYSVANPTGCLLVNPMFDGSGGSVGTGGAGNLAPNWTGAGTTAATGVIRTYAKVSSGGKAWQQTVLSGTAAGAAPSVQILRQIGLQGNISAGDTLEGVAEVEWDAGHANIVSIQFRLQFLDGSTSVWDVRDMDQRDATTFMPTGARAGLLRLQPVTVPAVSYTDARFSISVNGADASAMALTIRTRAMALRKVFAV